MFPSGEERPLAASLTPSQGGVLGNEIIAKVGTDGTVDLYNNSGQIDVVFDIAGWIPG